ncbi:uncharacterized protein LOC112097327 [Citrus clementina]|uniref:uncharacterized protein LOC112097327 n=1 Tax=Citrus clementina TaxID=85681 RepID=UPI000CED3FC0|nr:uncharacterized protein LOC112097327 [Citrus x clementina]
MAKCYILASISNILQTKHQNFETATEIMDSLQQMFGHSTRSARQAALKGIMNNKMGKGTRVRDHVLKMMDYLNKAEIQGAQIDDNSKIDMVLESLPETFKKFKVNYNMNKRNITLTELMNELHSAEEIYRAEKSLGSINITEKSSSSGPKPKGKEGKMTKRPFSAKGVRATVPLELVHTDVCGPINVQARGGYEYFITFTDDYSRYGYVYLMRHKSEALEKFKEYRAETESN